MYRSRPLVNMSRCAVGRRRGATGVRRSLSSQEPHPMYPNMFSPLDLGPDIEPLPNRVIMGSMHCGLEGHSIPKPVRYLLRMTAGESQADKPTYSHADEWAAYFAERARGGVSLMVTGGISPNSQGALTPFGSKLTLKSEVPYHSVVTSAVHKANPQSKILLQILHAGRYSVHPLLVAPSDVPSPLSPFTPKSMTRSQIHSTIKDFVNTAKLAHQAGYDGIELMGSEGYLLHQFLCPKTNKRTDEYGGDLYANRMRFALEIVREVRSALPPNFVIMFRLSMLDLVDHTSTWEEVVQLAQELQNSGVTIINTGIGWHEARVPTIATCVPRGAFTWVTQQMKTRLDGKTPLCTTNRINTPETIEHVLSTGQADLVSMARPFLADPDFIIKAWQRSPEEINTCIACNQACLDHVFEGKRASCLVNPRACHELELPPISTNNQTGVTTVTPAIDTEEQHVVAVIGAGPAGLAAATTFAQLGHNVTLYDKHAAIGGQFNMAKRIPGKNEFYETLRYFDVMMNKYGVKRQLKTVVESPADFVEKPDIVVLATGVLPRTPPIPNIFQHPKIVSYIDVLANNVPIGNKVAIIGAGGIGVDVAEFLLRQDSKEETLNDFFQEWHVDYNNWAKENHKSRGGLLQPDQRHEPSPKRHITLMQRKKGKIGATLGKTTGWIHRAHLAKGKVELLSGCSYDKFDQDGNLHITLTDKKGQTTTRVLEVDNVVICAGQEKCDALLTPLSSFCPTFAIGGAQHAGELDAKRAINTGTRLAYAVHQFGPGDKDAILKQVVGSRPVEDEELLVRVLNRLSGKSKR